MNPSHTTLITGGSGGIGLEMARLLAARGHGAAAADPVRGG
jgi:NAD(P)-dependent dehydrogenase (short-subunit alcohol dehydrogenase family)